MDTRVFNIGIAAGVLCTSIGAGLVYLPAGFITGGLLVLGLTVGLAMRAGVRG